MKKISISVRELVELILREGSIDNRFSKSNNRAIEGTMGHKNVQKNYNENSLAEVVLKHEIIYDDIIIAVEGRADGILKVNNEIIVDEIKTTARNLDDVKDDNSLHWEQAKCYGYIYCNDNDLSNIKIQLTYYNIENKDTKKFIRDYTFEGLKNDFKSLIEKYKEFVDIDIEWQEKRDFSIKNMEFPFKEYRKGQRELAVAVFKTINQGKKLFASAPTGIGKTISTIFPALKSLSLKNISKIFYLTSKTITREVAENSIANLRRQGSNIKGITITAKDKICFKDKSNCNPEFCEYAKDYYSNINGILKEILKDKQEFKRDDIEELAKKYKVCPFELSLDLSLFCDIIICDYNYVFSPTSYLKRFFDVKKAEYTLLIDEGHNLVDRGRDMYSSGVLKGEVHEVKNYFKAKSSKIHKILEKIENFFISSQKYVLKNCMTLNTNIDTAIVYKSKDSFAEENEPIALISILREFVTAFDEDLERGIEVEEFILDFYFKIYEFLNVSEFYDNSYVTLYKELDNDFEIKLYCVNPSKVLNDVMKKVKASIIFSATLIPMDYYKDILGNYEDYHIILPTPFDKENRLLMINERISTTYKNRSNSKKQVAQNIVEMAKAKKGNYMVFFPSYKYMKDIYDETNRISEKERFTTSLQKPCMTEEEKENFLLEFQPGNYNIGFCVLGGHFSEGIDLPSKRLIGVIIVGIGMPLICDERDIIKLHFQKRGIDGFNYAYVYPGMVKVLQGVGRCIRSQEDIGAILLMDLRYGSNLYKNLFPKDWFPFKTIKKISDIKEELYKFW